MTKGTKQDHFRDATEKVDNWKAQILKNAIQSSAKNRKIDEI